MLPLKIAYFLYFYVLTGLICSCATIRYDSWRYGRSSPPRDKGEVDAAGGDVAVVDVAGCGAVVAGVEYLRRGPLDTAAAVAVSS